ncbi:hypothetical protein, partial [Actinoplanes sp. NPDC049802]|uniref:hypothetical protein n=1 Tax=Actinoplanes sp. NPDC049802 TaxID=3154742 RepID=UPI0033F3EC53
MTIDLPAHLAETVATLAERFHGIHAVDTRNPEPAPPAHQLIGTTLTPSPRMNPGDFPAQTAPDPPTPRGGEPHVS